MEQLSGLINFALTPLGLGLAVIGIVVLISARSSPWLPWFVLSGLIFAASLNRFVNEWYPNPPPFWGPIDILVGNGRPLTILLLGLAVFLPVRSARRLPSLAPFARAFLIAEMVIVLKIFIGGSMGFAALAAVMTGLVFFLISQIGGRWIQTEVDIDRAIVSIAVAIAVFVALNALQLIVGPNALAVANGRFNGTTGNPQHAAVFLGAGIPALVYVALTRRLVLKLAAIATAAIAIYFLLWSGSRTGLLIVAMTTLLLLRRAGPAVLAGYGLVILGGLFFLFTRLSDDLNLARFTSTQDTRTQVWAALWRGFEENPLLGVPITGDRLGFGENSWLAMASATGLVGLLPLLTGGILLLAMARQLLFRPSPSRHAQLQSDFIGGVIISLMIGSIFEAYLLSALSSGMIILLLIGTIGTRRRTLNIAARQALWRERRALCGPMAPVPGGPLPGRPIGR